MSAPINIVSPVEIVRDGDDAWDVAYAALFPASDEAGGAEFESAIGPLGAVLTFTLRARRGD